MTCKILAMPVCPENHLRGFGARIAHFGLIFDEEAVPVVYVCSVLGCESLAYFQGVVVEREGHVTCMKCLLPMGRANCTVH